MRLKSSRKLKHFNANIPYDFQDTLTEIIKKGSLQVILNDMITAWFDALLPRLSNPNKSFTPQQKSLASSLQIFYQDFLASFFHH